MRNRILKNLRQQEGIYYLRPREQFHFAADDYIEHIVYFTGDQLRVAINSFDTAKENHHQYQYLLADNDFTWCLYRLECHTYNEISSAISIEKGALELIPYDSGKGYFFSVKYLDNGL